MGTLIEHNVRGGYLIVRKGRLFPENVRIPLAAVRRTDGVGIHLRMYRPLARATEQTRAAQSTTMRKPENGAGLYDGMAEAEVRNGEVHVPLREEEMVIAKETHEIGHVYVHTYIVEEPRTITLPVTHEEVRIERVPVAGNVSPGLEPFAERHIDVPLMGELVVVNKQIHVVEEVRVRKEQVTEERQVTETLRKERVSIADDGTGEATWPDDTHSEQNEQQKALRLPSSPWARLPQNDDRHGAESG
jgi:uncharacterized protein (TIGR02271 family)